VGADLEQVRTAAGDWQLAGARKSVSAAGLVKESDALSAAAFEVDRWFSVLPKLTVTIYVSA
jgi:hypothetical protein